MLNELKTVSYFHAADWWVFFAVLAATAAAAVYGNRRLKKNRAKSR